MFVCGPTTSDDLLGPQASRLHRAAKPPDTKLKVILSAAQHADLNASGAS